MLVTLIRFLKSLMIAENKKWKVHALFIEAERALIVKFPARTGSPTLTFSVNK